MNRSLFLLVILSISTPLFAGNLGWHRTDGTQAPNTNERKSINGFGAWLILTSDITWQDKFKVSPNKSVKLSQSAQIKVGEQLTFIVLYINPMLDLNGAIKLTCDLSILNPAGNVMTVMDGHSCESGKLAGKYENVRRALAVTITAEEGDPLGSWKVNATVRDNNSGTEISLNNSFELVP